MSERIDVITGAGSGIGRALARALLADGGRVLGVGRRHVALSETGQDNSRFEAVAADVATESGRGAISEAVGERGVRFLVHNAGRLEPVAPLARVSLDAWRANMAVNVEAPLFLTQCLLDRLDGGRILHISSGAAHRGIPGWGAYCTAKAALHMLWQQWKAELEARDIAAGSLRPGVVDTPMQALIRGQSAENFPQVAAFRALKDNGELASPEAVATFARRVLCNTNRALYESREWALRDHADDPAIADPARRS